MDGHNSGKRRKYPSIINVPDDRLILDNEVSTCLAPAYSLTVEHNKLGKLEDSTQRITKKIFLIEKIFKKLNFSTNK